MDFAYANLLLLCMAYWKGAEVHRHRTANDKKYLRDSTCQEPHKYYKDSLLLERKFLQLEQNSTFIITSLLGCGSSLLS